MNSQSEIYKTAWTYRAYEFWHMYNGVPKNVAKKMVKDPYEQLEKHIEYLGDVNEQEIY